MAFDPFGFVKDKILDPLFDPGKDDRKKAEKVNQQAVADWEGLTPPDLAPITSSNFDFGDGTEAGKFDWYDSGPALSGQIGYIGQKDLNPLAVATNDPTGRNLQLDSADYFKSIETNPIDAIAEAEYQRRKQQAEQNRRANTDAALASLEAKGMGGGTASILANAKGTQDSVADQYQAGLQQNAIAQARRDAAAGQVSDIGSAVSKEDWDEAKKRSDDENARAQDEWNNWYRSKTYDVGNFNAAVGADTQRIQSTRDKNTVLANQTAQYNLGLPQQNFNNQVTKTQGTSAARMGQASGLRSDAANTFAYGPLAAGIIANVAMAGAGGPAAASSNPFTGSQPAATESPSPFGGTPNFYGQDPNHWNW